MKKTLLLALASCVIAGMASCKKEDTTAPTPSAQTQTINVSLRAGESYSYTLPSNLPAAQYGITTPAQHASFSELSASSSGEQLYKYTPASGYTGTDQVIVSNVPGSRPAGAQGPPPCGSHGSCSGGSDEHCTVTINFTVSDTTAVSR